MKKLISLVLVAALLVCGVVAFSSCSKEKVKFGVQSGTTGWSFMSGDADWGFEGFKNVDVRSYDEAGLAVQDMISGVIDYVVIDAEVGKNLAAVHSQIKVIDIPLTIESYGIAVDKNQADLLAQINNVLATKQADIEAIFAKYANVDDNNSTNWSGETIPAGTYDPNKNQLVVATNAAFAPFEFTVGQNFAGIDMEIAKLIADTLGMELVIKNMEFDAITLALGTDGIDVGIAGMTINANRAKVVNFSNPYYTDAYQVILAMKDDDRFDDCKTTEDVLKILKELGEE